MPHGDKSSYASLKKHQAHHIEKDCGGRGFSAKEAAATRKQRGQ